MELSTTRFGGGPRKGLMTALLSLAVIVPTARAAPPSVQSQPLPVASSESVGFSSERLERLNEAMRAQVASGKYAGITTLVVRHGKVLNFETVGQQDLARRTPLRKDSIFRIASMTKPIIGVALMILYEEGKWNLDDPVAKFIPEFAALKVMTPDGRTVEPDHPMTMRELVTNCGGIASFPTSQGAPRNPAVTKLYGEAGIRDGALAEGVARIARIPLAFQPGSDFEYGLSQDVQGHVIERISGQRLDVFLKARIFDPLGMADTGFGVAAEKRDRLVTAYAYDSAGRLTPADLDESRRAGTQPAYLSGAGGLYSTATDYARFATMLASGGRLGSARLLAPASVKLMTRDLLPTGVKQHFKVKLDGLGYGVGVGVVLDPGRASFTSGGLGEGTYYWTGMFGSWWWNDPVNDITVVGLAQVTGAAAAHIGYTTPAPDLRAQSIPLIYGALVEPVR